MCILIRVSVCGCWCKHIERDAAVVCPFDIRPHGTIVVIINHVSWQWREETTRTYSNESKWKFRCTENVHRAMSARAKNNNNKNNDSSSERQTANDKTDFELENESFKLFNCEWVCVLWMRECRELCRLYRWSRLSYANTYMKSVCVGVYNVDGSFGFRFALFQSISRFIRCAGFLAQFHRHLFYIVLHIFLQFQRVCFFSHSV